MKNYYQILNINKDASQSEIKKAYRQLSKQFHPDVNPGGEDKFKEIAEAYDVLSDEKKRKQYDNPNPFGNGNPFDMFNDIVNKQRRQRKPTTKDRVVKVTLTPEQSYKGEDKEMTYKAKESCELCAGTGGNKNICTSCNGNGVHQQRMGTGFFSQIVETRCPSCQGRGQIVIDPCMNCNGIGSVDRFKSIKVNIPRGVDNGDFLRVTGKGDFINGIQGDLLVQITLLKSQYEKVGRDLVYQLIMSPVDMITNQQINIPHPDGELQINLPPILSTEKPLRIKSKGFVTNTGIGDFYIKIAVINKEISEDEKSKLKELLK
jgi:molecular chaperone DnaJ|tara:strand:+ start:10291 stop:11244 length:954 start_codon:yes stop_codon:yes gene_type:complete